VGWSEPYCNTSKYVTSCEYIRVITSMSGCSIAYCVGVKCVCLSTS